MDMNEDLGNQLIQPGLSTGTISTAPLMSTGETLQQYESRLIRERMGSFPYRYKTSLAAWLEGMRPSHIFTLTFARVRSDERAEAAFTQWWNALEKTKRGPVGYFRSTERNWSGLGLPGGRLHFHGLLYGGECFSKEQLERPWKQEFGMARIEPYILGGGGAGYAVKKVVRYGEWAMRRLEKFAKTT